MSAAWVRLRQQGKGRFRWTTASTLMARRRLAQTAGPGVLSGSAPGTWVHTLHRRPGQAGRPRAPADDLRLDFGGTAEIPQNPLLQANPPRSASIAG